MSTNTYLFPDVNVWLALAHEIHPHHAPAIKWEHALDPGATLCFCRFTQLGLLRLLTNSSAMGKDALTQAQAWKVYDSLAAAGATLIDEPHGLEPAFRRLTRRDEASTKQWADGYLAAFATAAKIPLVTFDKTLAAAIKSTVLLR